MMSEKAISQEPQVYKWEINDVNRRLDRIEKKIRIIIALLVEKEMIGEALQKAIEETESSSIKLDKKTLAWLME
jgi:hypothetical protein